MRAGSADFVRQGDSLLVKQGSQKLIVDWKEFSIGKGEVTRFLQPGADSAALNRVFSGNPSAIYGSLEANGKVYLINPNGVFIGPSGRIDAGSFIASTLDTSDAEFLKGGNLTLAGKSEASVVNLGTINALDGDVYLIAKTVENHGTISAPNGTTGLAGGTEVIIQPAADEKLGVSIASGAGKVVNTGKIAAAQAELKAAGGNLYALAIQNSGNVRATGVERKAGRVFLRATTGTIQNTGTVGAKNANGSGGRVTLGPANKSDGSPGPKAGVRVSNSGVLDGSGTSGGVVTVSAEDVLLSDTSQLLATGGEGSGGEVSIDASSRIAAMSGSVANVSGTTGGSIRYVAGEAADLSGTLLARGSTGSGGSLTSHAPSVTARSAVLDVSGSTGGSIRLTGGNVFADGATSLMADGEFGGGTIIAIADDGMEFHGDISARASAENALGGLAEVSGLNSLVFDGTADLRSTLGNTGTLTLDPTNFTIDAGAAAVITNNLLTSNVIIATSSAGSAPGDIFVNAPVLYSSANSLSLLAHRHIQANARIQNSGTGTLNLVAGWDGVTGATGVQFALFTGAPSSFGNNGGSVFIGNGTQASSVAVGSRFGATNVAGLDITVAGGQSNTASAQVGFRGEGSDINGPIRLELKGDLTVAGGNANFSQAQIGHGGPSINANIQGSISINTPGDIRITGGVNFSYAQIGHGGDRSSGSQSGAITIRTNDLSLIGGTHPQANAQVGHGDASGDASGSRAGAIDIRATGETSLVNGPGNNAVWLIGHGTSTPSGVSGADVFFSTGALDHSASVIATRTTLSQEFADKFNRNLLGGNVTINASGNGGMFVDGAFNYSSSHRLALIADGSATVSASITNGGSGEINLVIDNANSVRPNLNSAATLTIAPSANLTSGGPVRIFAVNPANTNLGGFTPAQRRYGVWFGDAVTVAGVNYKFQPTLTLTADSFTKTYGQTFTFAGSEFTFSGLQPGDSLSQILSGNVGLSSPGSVATAAVAVNPYPILFDTALTANFGYGLRLVNGTLNVTPAGLTITANNQSKVYGEVFSFAGTEFTSSGLKNGDLIGSVNLTSPGTLATAGVAGYGITAAGASGATFNPNNYTISYQPGTLNVTPAGLTITANSQSKVYGEVFSFAGTEFTSSGLKNGDLIGSVNLTSPGTLATAGVAGYGITAAGASGATFNPNNYTISYQPGTLNVTPAGLTITANSQSKVYGEVFSFAGTEFTSSGLKNGDLIGSVNLTSPGTLATAGVAGYGITAAGASGATFNPNNYTISYVGGNLAVTPAGLTITANSQSKVYGEVFSFAGTEFTSSGLKNGDLIGSVNLTSPGTLATAGVAGYGITAAGASGATFNPNNYTISYVGGNLAVTPAGLTITANSQSKVYGEVFSFAGTEFTSSGLKNGDLISSVNLTSPGTLATAGVAGYGITAAGASGATFNPNNYTISYQPGTLNVTPAGLTITANSQSKVYGEVFSFAGTEFTSSGLKNGDLIGSVNLTSPGTLATAGVAGYGITAAGASGASFNPNNYTISYQPGTLNVTPAGLTITANSQSKVYGEVFSFAGTEFTSSGLKNGDLIGSVNLTSPGTLATAGVAGYGITAAGASGATFNPNNYTISYQPGTLNVTPAGLTITANSQSKIYGEVFSFAGTEFTSSGLKNGDLIGSVNLTSPGTLATAGVAGYGITAAGASGATFNPNNYTISYQPGTLNVTPAGLTITANSQSKIYGEVFSFAGTEFTSSGLKNGDLIGSVNLTSPGTLATAGVAGYGITAAGASGATFNPNNYTISYQPGTLNVTPAGLTITANSQSKVYGEVFSFAGTEFTSSGLKNGDLISSVNLTSPGTLATAGVAGYGITAAGASGATFNPNNYTISYQPGTLNVTPAGLTITANSQSKVYGEVFSFAGTEFTSSGLKNGDLISSVNLTSPGTLATAGVAGGPYAITIANPQGGTFDANNYTISFVEGSLVVTRAGLVITAGSQSKLFGTTLILDDTKFTVSGLKNGETIGSVTLSSDGAPASALTGNYPIIAANASGGTYDPANYAVEYEDGTLVVFKAPIVDPPPPPDPPAPPVVPPPPPTQPPPPLDDLQRLLAVLGQDSTPQSAGDDASNDASVISGFGIQRLGRNLFFGEQLVETGGALMIDSSGLGPLLPIAEGPQILEDELDEQPHQVLEEAIAEDDRARNIHGKTRRYEVTPGEVLSADVVGGVGFDQLHKGPAVLQRATEEDIERRLLRAAEL